MNEKFNRRSFIAMTILISGIGLPISGLINHHYGFDPPTLAKHAWMSAHNVLGFLFLVFSIWHAVQNRRALVKHIKNGARKVKFVGREAIAACALTLLLLTLAVGHAFIAAYH